MTESQMFDKSFERPKNFFKLSGEEQWAIDKRLGILDWDGKCIHTSDSPQKGLCPECKAKFVTHYEK